MNARFPLAARRARARWDRARRAFEARQFTADQAAAHARRNRDFYAAQAAGALVPQPVPLPATLTRRP